VGIHSDEKGKATESDRSIAPNVDSWFRQVLETAQEGIWAADTTGRTTFVNQHMADILGRTIAELGGASIFDLIAREALDEAMTDFGRNFTIRAPAAHHDAVAASGRDQSLGTNGREPLCDHDGGA
jgi:PAS domain S-box-containing protein